MMSRKGNGLARRVPSIASPTLEDSMLRLTRTTRLPHEVVIVLEGQIVAEWVKLLEEECLELSGTDQKVLLDLAGVSYLDRRAVRLLRELSARSISIVNCPPLVEDLLREDAS
jgi:anti-anti-sigma regulatory factor